MRNVPFRRQRSKENWSRPERDFQARNIYGERKQSDDGIAEDLDRKRRFTDARDERFARRGANPRCRRLRKNIVSLRCATARPLRFWIDYEIKEPHAALRQL